MSPTSDVGTNEMSWAQRAAERRSPAVEKARLRSLERTNQVLEAAARLIDEKGSDFTAHELAKEAGVAIQTLYKYVGGKDQVLLAVLEKMISATCADLELRAAELPDPVERLRFYVTQLVREGDLERMAAPAARFVATEHWRLQQTRPTELAVVISPYSVLLRGELQRAADAGMLSPGNVEYGAWLATQLVVAVFHHYAFATAQESVDEIAQGLWRFCLGAWGGQHLDSWPDPGSPTSVDQTIGR